MSRSLFQILDQVQSSWPLRARLLCFQLVAPPMYALEAARAAVLGWSPAELMVKRRQLAALAATLTQLYQRLVVAAGLALLLGLAVAVSAGVAGELSGVQHAVLTAVVCAIVLPPIAICNGIARDCLAAQALLAVCGAAETRAR